MEKRGCECDRHQNMHQGKTCDHMNWVHHKHTHGTTFYTWQLLFRRFRGARVLARSVPPLFRQEKLLRKRGVKAAFGRCREPCRPCPPRGVASGAPEATRCMGSSCFLFAAVLEALMLDYCHTARLMSFC